MYSSTRIVFPAGQTEASSRIVHLHRLTPTAAAPEERGASGAVRSPDPGRWVVITEQTPFHPLDHTWPDQPGDSGQLVVDGETLTVDDCLTAACPTEGGSLAVDGQITARRGSKDHYWYAAHVLSDAHDSQDLRGLAGADAHLRVDTARRRSLSTAHSVCHLVGLAINTAFRERWRQQVTTDGLGRPDFDALAIASSRLTESGSTDVHRLGSSLRRRGFVADGLADVLPGLVDEVSATVHGWLAADAPITVTADGDRLEDTRTWTCTLPEGTHHTHCGGTHPERTGELAVTSVGMALDPDGKTLTVTTRTHPSGDRP
ncbi:metal-dependent hydrolase [Streptomyces sp. NPDC001073]